MAQLARKAAPVSSNNVGRRGTTVTAPPGDLPEVFEAYLRYLDAKVAFLEHLYRNDHKEEALTLCCVYIEGLAQRIYSTEQKKEGSRKLFVRVLLQHGGEESLCLVDPPTLANSVRGAKKCGAPHLELATSIEENFCESPVQLRTIDDLVAEAEAKLGAEELALLKETAWMGTIAALAYREFRNPLIHDLHASHGLVFSNTLYRGSPIGRISFVDLYRALVRVVDHWKTVFAASLPTREEVGE